METLERNNLRQHHVTLVDELDPSHIMDDLYQDGILTENDCDHIKSDISRKDKCRLLLTLLPTRGPSAYGLFLKSLEDDYHHLAALLRTEHIQEEHVDIPFSCPNKEAAEISWKYSRTETVVNDIKGGYPFKACNQCRPFIPDFAVPELEILIKQNCCLILRDVEANDLIDLHYQEFVLGGEEYERITSGKTRKERCILFISELSKCTRSQVTSVFIRSLEKKYGYIVSRLRNATSGLTENLQKQPITADAPVPICGDVHHMGVRAQTANAMMNVSFSQLQSPHFKGKHHKNECLDDTEFAIRRSRHSKQERRLFDKRSQHDKMLTWYQDNLTDKRLPFSCPVNLQRQLLKRKKEMVGTSSLADNVHNAQGRCKFGRTHKKIKDGKSEKFATSPISKKKTRDIQRKDKSPVYVKSMTNTNRYPDNNCRTTDENKTLKSLPTLTMVSSPAKSRSRRVEVAFNFLSSLINQGDFQKFENFATKIKLRYGEEADMMCILDYLYANRDLFISDVDSAKRNINTGLERVAKTSNPNYFRLELFEAQATMYLDRRKLSKLYQTLNDAKMIVEADHVGCSDAAAGWLFIKNVRDIFTRQSELVVNQPNYPGVYESLHDEAVENCKRALDIFFSDGGKDGRFGHGFALCYLAKLLLRCGENGLTMDIHHPDIEDIVLAGKYLEEIENWNIPIPKIPEVHYLIAKSDFEYRRANSIRALEHAKAAYQLTKEMNLRKSIKRADHNRIVFLKTLSVSFKPLDEEEASRILFDDSADSNY